MKHLGIVVAVVLAMSGCAGSEPVAIAPPIAAPAVYATDLPAAGLQEEWWLGFGDPVLDRLVRRGLEANLDIDAASGRLAAAAALLRAERADRLPGLDGSAEIGTTLVGEGEDTAVAGLFALFDPDLNGRLAAEVRAAVADYADLVIVGSALVKTMHEAGAARCAAEAGRFVSALRRGIDG